MKRPSRLKQSLRIPPLYQNHNLMADITEKTFHHLPTNYRHLSRPPLNNHYRQAMEEHMASHHEMGSFEECSPRKANNHQILACMWVFTYKFGKAGYIIKVKAKLIIRGD